MAKIPDTTTTVSLIYKQYEDKQKDNGWREHCGASGIGDPCYRKCWYDFHWALPKDFSGRLLRLFQRGHNEEHIFNKELREIGCTVHEVNPETGEQWMFADHGGHFGGSCDGMVLGLVEAPKTWHILEYKTSSDKAFKTLVKNGVEKDKPQHYAQMQLYMGWSSFKRAFYMVTNKNTDDIYQERIHFNKNVFDALRNKAKKVIFESEPLHRLKSDASYWPCNYCDYKMVCHHDKIPAVNCRTCAHSTPREDGKWWCELVDTALDKDKQIIGCDSHLFNPHLLPGEVVESGEGNEYVMYKYGDIKYTNIIGGYVKGDARYTSKELYNLPPELIGSKGIDVIKDAFDATIGAKDE